MMEQKIMEYMRRNGMTEAGDHILVACSGGADSVCLLLILHACREQLGISLSAVHVEHGIRGDESREDAAFVRALCARLGIPLMICPVDVPQYALQHRLGTEEAARILRYEQLEQCAGQNGAHTKIAVAHHIEDNVETVLFQMARGSGLAGMAGIAPVRRSGTTCYIRPLLCVSREEIEQYLAEHGQEYRTDRTNSDESYTRNRIRNTLLPQLAGINPQAIAHINESAGRLREVYDFIQEQATAFYREHVQQAEHVLQADSSALSGLHPALRQEVLRMLLFEASGHRKDIAAVHVDALEHLMRLQSGRRLDLPYGVTAYMEYDKLCLTGRGIRDGKEPAPFWVTAEQIARCRLGGDAVCLWASENGQSLWGRVYARSVCGEEIIKKPYTKQLDYDKMKNGFFVRTRQNGDYFVINDVGQHKKLSDYMINEKIPAMERDNILLIAQDHHIAWIIGGRIGEDYKIGKDTALIFELQYNGGNIHGLHDKA